MVGCAAPEAVRKEASLTLIGDCKKIFLDGSVGHYQYISQAVDKSTSFALAIGSNGNQVCGWSSWKALREARGCEFFCEDDYTHEELDTLAIVSCEQARKGTGIKKGCKVYARGNEIIWGKEDAKNLDFE